MYLGKSETNSVVTLPVLLYKILPLCRIFLISLDAQLSFYVYDRSVIIYNLQHIGVLVLGPER